MVIRATRRSSHFQGKGSTFISQSFWNPEYWSSPENRTRDLPLCSHIALSSELILLRLKRFLKRFSTSFRSKTLLWEISMKQVSQTFCKTWHFTLGLPSVMLWRPIQSQKTLLFINLLIRTQLTTLTSLRNCNKKVQCIFFDEMYQHIDAKKLSFRLKAEGVLVDQKEGKHYKKTKFKQTYESSLSTVIIKNQSLPLK